MPARSSSRISSTDHEQTKFRHVVTASNYQEQESTLLPRRQQSSAKTRIGKQTLGSALKIGENKNSVNTHTAVATNTLDDSTVVLQKKESPRYKRQDTDEARCSSFGILPVRTMILTPSVTVGVIHSALAWRPLLHRATSNTFLNKYFRLIVCMEKNQYRNRTWLSVNKIKQNTARHKTPDGHDHVVMNEYPPRHVFYL